MSANSDRQAVAAAAQFELKAGTFTLPVLRLLGTDMEAMAQQLANKVDQAGEFFHNAPVVIDLEVILEMIK